MSATRPSPLMRRRTQLPRNPTASNTTSHNLHFRNPLFADTQAGVSPFTNSGLGVANHGFLGDITSHAQTSDYNFEPSPLPLFDDTSTPTHSATHSFFASLASLPTTARANSPPLALNSFSGSDSGSDLDERPHHLIDTASSSSHEHFVDTVAEINMRYILP